MDQQKPESQDLDLKQESATSSENGGAEINSVASKLQESEEILKQLKETSLDDIPGLANEDDQGPGLDSIASDAGQDVTAATIGRMLGLATNSEIKLLAQKLDLLATKVNNLNVRLEKVGVLMAKAPTGSDLDRIDVQIGALRTLIKEALISAFGDKSEGGDKGMKKAKIMSNKE